MSSPGPADLRLQLSDGNEIPMLGLGVWQVPNGPECVNAVRWAMELGYRHVDTAQAYGNEESVSRGIQESGVPRAEVFITTKFNPSANDPVVELQRSLQRLGTDYVDLYIVHWPGGGPLRAWAGMEQAHQARSARLIGVSNFSVGELERVLAEGAEAPAVDQVQFSPFEYRRKLLDAASARGVAIEAYSPLGTGRHLADREVREIADRLGRTPAQVLLRWCIQKDLVVISKSTHRDRIAENAQIFDFELSLQDMGELDRLDRTGGTGEARERKWW